MNYKSHTSQGLSNQARCELFTYRYEVFVDRLGWDLDTENGYESDQFDHSETIYVVARNEDSQITGCARLLPTTLPYLLEEVFPELLNGLKPPKSAEIWELSRFTSLDLQAETSPTNAQFSAEHSVDLLKAAIRCAQEHGAKRMISVSPLGVERLLRKAGFKAHRAGPPKIINGYPLFACWIELE